MYIRSLDWAKLIGHTSAAASTTPLQDLPSPPPLLLLLDVPFPDLKSLILCHLGRVHQEDRSSFTRKSTSLLKNVLAKALLSFTRKSTHFQDRACKCTFNFHSEVTSSLKIVLASALVTFTHKSLRCYLHPIREGSPLWQSSLFVVQSSCSCEPDTAIRATSSVSRTPTVGLVLHVVKYLLSYCNTSSGTGSHSTLSYLVCGASSSSNELVLATRCHLNKINRKINKPSHHVKVTQFSDTIPYKNKHVILSCGMPQSNICLRSGSEHGLPLSCVPRPVGGQAFSCHRNIATPPLTNVYTRMFLEFFHALRH